MTPYPFIYYYVYALPTNVYYVCVVNMYNDTAYSYIRLINLSKRRYKLLLILSIHYTCYTYISMFRLYRKVILYIMHFVRDVFNLPHSYSRSIDHSKSLNTIPVNNYSYKTNNSINPLTTYNYFNIPKINIVVVPVKPIPLNDFLLIT